MFNMEICMGNTRTFAKVYAAIRIQRYEIGNQARAILGTHLIAPTNGKRVPDNYKRIKEEKKNTEKPDSELWRINSNATIKPKK